MSRALIFIALLLNCLCSAAPVATDEENSISTTVTAQVASGEGEKSDTNNSGKILIAVVSAPTHEEARIAIRNTWGRLTDEQAKRVDVRFFMGRISERVPDRENILKIISKSNDVIQSNTFTEHYHNLTLKAKSIFSYAHAQGYDMLFKVDDDSFVRVENLLSYINSIGDDPAIYAGHINRPEYQETTVHKNPQSKWYMYDQYPHEEFPAFADGPGVLLGKKAVRFLAENRDTLFDYRCDDAAVAIWTDPLNLNKKDLKCSIYEFTCSKDDVFVNPVASGEMYVLNNYKNICESGYTLEVCLDQPCLCKGHPERTKCWQEIIDQNYHDIIPR